MNNFRNPLHLIPRLRFANFRSEWRKECLGKVYPKIRNGFVGTATPFYAKVGVSYIQGNNIKNGKIKGTVDIFVTKEFSSKYSNSILRKKDLVMVQSGHVGECAVVDIDNVGANCHAIIIMSPNMDVCSEFYKNYFYSPIGKKGVYRVKTGNTVEHILASDMKVMQVPSCSLREQQKIADFLGSVDEWIENLEKQKEILETYKKGLMQKIFSQQIRFKDDNSEDFPKWKEVKLRNIFVKKIDKNRDDKVSFVLTNSATEGIVSQIDYFEKDIANKSNLTNYYIVDIDDFIYNPRISKHAPVGPLKRNTLSIGVMSPLYAVIRLRDGNKYFYEKYFETTFWHRYMKQVANYGARHDRMAISSDDFMNMPIPYPSIKEQEKISEFLSLIDNLYKSKHMQITKAKQWKKGLLQQMFV